MSKKRYLVSLAMIVLLGALLGWIAPQPARAATVRYASPAGLTSGACDVWANACTLQYALSVAVSGDEIWVQTGTHYPGASGVRTATYQLKNGVAVYGGFAGTESARSQRDWTANLTTLSGDLDGSGTKTDNDAYHVVTGSGVDATAVLDGFTITGGYANGGGNNGAGVLNSGGSPTLANLIIAGNTAVGNGGGMLNVSSSHPNLTHVTFSSNVATAAAGGGVFNDTNSHPTFTDVTFTNNTAATWGGGMYSRTSNYTFTGGSFSGNSAQWGGGMVNNNNTPTLVNITLSNNSATSSGGGMQNESGSNPALIKVTLSGNAAQRGGGMANSNSTPTLINVTLSGNTADSGGGIYNSASSPSLVNVALLLNTAESFGGGMENTNNSSPALVNVTLAHNSAGRYGGGIDNYLSSSPALTNTILWGNSASDGAQVWNNAGSIPAYAYSDIQDAYASGDWDSDLGIDAGHNTDADPLFGTQSAYPPAGSPALDAGDPTALPLDAYDLDGDGILTETLPIDLDGGERVWGAGLDLGAYEFRIWYVDADAAPGNGCASWADACPDLQTALALPPGEIWVAEGLYQPGAAGVVTATYRLHNGQALYGGFAGSETERTQRDWTTHVVTLTGDLDGSESFTAGDAYHVVTTRDTDPSVVLDGFTITGGNAPYISGCSFNTVDGICQGGGILNWYGSPVLSNLAIQGNQATFGGGVFSRFGSPALTNVTLHGNTIVGPAQCYGGGMYSADGSPVLTDVAFLDNAANGCSSSLGGGMYGSGTLTNVTFTGNSASNGGGMYGSGTLAQVTFDGNTSGISGGGMFTWGSFALTDVVFRNNSCTSTGLGGGGLYTYYATGAALTSVTFDHNTVGGYGGGMLIYGPSSILLTKVTFNGNTSGISGGGMYNHIFTSITLVDVVFSGNTAASNGGGMFSRATSFSPSSLELTNVTLSHNTAGGSGGGVRNDSYVTTWIENSLLWGNTAASGPQVSNGTTGVTSIIAYSDIQDSGGSGAGWDAGLGTDGGGNIDADPLFVDADGADDVYGTLDDDLHLTNASPAIDAGDNTAVPTDTLDLDDDGDTAEPLPYDMDGHPRFVDHPRQDTGSGTPPIVDMGAYETPNTPPILGPLADQSTPEDTPTVPITFTVGDLESAPISLTVSAVTSDPALLPLSNILLGGAGVTHTVALTPSADQNGTVTVTLSVSDGVNVASSAFVLTVLPVNDPPTISDIADQSTDEDMPTGAIPFTVGDIDNPPEALTLTAVSSDPALVPVANIAFGGTGVDRTVAITPAADLNGAARVTLTVSDGALAADTSFTLTVHPVNDPPTISGIADQSTDEDTPTGAVPFTVGDIDNPPETLTLTAVSSDPALVPVANVVFGGAGVTRTVAITPAADLNGAARVTLTVSDGALTADTSFVLTVHPVNDAPVLAPIGDRFVDEGQTLAMTVTATDVDLPPDTLVFSLGPGAPVGVSLDPLSGLLTWTPTEAQGPGLYPVTVRVADDGTPPLFAERVFTLTVGEVNLPPVAVDDGYTTPEDTVLAVAAPGVLANDGDSDLPANPLSAAVLVAPSAGTLLLSRDGAFVYTPSLNFAGVVSFTYLLSDGALTDTAAAWIGVTSLNDPPLVEAGPDQDAIEGTAVHFAGSYEDSGLLAAPLIVWSFGDGASAVGSLEVEHVYADDGRYTVTLTVVDGQGAAGWDTLQVTVTNAAPLLAPLGNLSGLAGEPIAVSGTFTDAGALDAHQVEIEWAPGVSETQALEVGARSFALAHTYTAAGVYSVTVTVRDDDGGWDRQDLTLTVTARPVEFWIYLPLVVRAW